MVYIILCICTLGSKAIVSVSCIIFSIIQTQIIRSFETVGTIPAPLMGFSRYSVSNLKIPDLLPEATTVPAHS